MKIINKLFNKVDAKQYYELTKKYTELNIKFMRLKDENNMLKIFLERKFKEDELKDVLYLVNYNVGN